MRLNEDGVLSEVRMRGEGLSIGTTSTDICPYCSGGSPVEKSFRLTRVEADVLKFICHRASCGRHGVITGASSFVAYGPSQDGPKEAYDGKVQRLGKEWLSELHDYYGIRESEATRHGWLEEAGSGRIVVPIRGVDYSPRGIHTRCRRSRVGLTLKTRDYRGLDIWVGWFHPAESPVEDSPIVLVEDVFSAAKVAQAGFLAASLMGSHFGPDILLEVFGFERDQIRYLALDRDAAGKSLLAVSTYSFVHGGNLKPLLLSKDIKFESEDTIRKMIDGSTA